MKKKKSYTLDQINLVLLKAGIGPKIIAQALIALNAARGLGIVEKEMNMRSFQAILLEGMDKFPLTAGEREEANKRFGKTQCSIAKNKRGEFFAYTHRARSKFYPSIAELPKDKVKFISSTS